MKTILFSLITPFFLLNQTAASTTDHSPGFAEEAVSLCTVESVKNRASLTPTVTMTLQAYELQHQDKSRKCKLMDSTVRTLVMSFGFDPVPGFSMSYVCHWEDSPGDIITIEGLCNPLLGDKHEPLFVRQIHISPNV